MVVVTVLVQQMGEEDKMEQWCNEGGEVFACLLDGNYGKTWRKSRDICGLDAF